MAATKKPRKKYRPRPVRAPALIGVHNIWAAPTQLLHDIRHSEVWTIKGAVVMPSLDMHNAYNASETLELFAYFIDEVCALRRVSLDTGPILRLANRLKHDMPIDDAALAPVESLMEQGRRLANTITPNQALAILQSHGEKPCGTASHLASSGPSAVSKPSLSASG